MNETVSNEISNLFQELIVSKIKLIIDELKNRITDIEDSENSINESINKLPKQSGIKKIIVEQKDEIVSHIDSCFGKLKTETYLKGIVEFLKQHYCFPNDKKLWEYLISMSDDIAKQIDAVITSQNDLDKKLCEVDRILDQYKDVIIESAVHEKTEIIDEIKQSFRATDKSQSVIKEQVKTALEYEKENAAKLDLVIQKVNQNGEELNNNSSKTEQALERLNAVDDIISILNHVDASLGFYQDEMDTSMKEEVASIKSDVISLQKSCSIMQGRIEEHIEFVNKEYYEIDKKLRIMTIISSLSIVGIVALAILQFIV